MLLNDVFNPIPKAVRDPDELTQFFADNRFIPAYGSSTESSHGTLKLQHDLAQLSPSKEAVINFYNRYAFGGKIDLIEAAVPGLVMSEEPPSISDKEKRSIAKALANVGFTFDQFQKLSHRHNKDDFACGNMYTIYEEITVNSTKQVVLDYMHPRQCFYILPKSRTTVFEMAVFKYGWNLRQEAMRKYEKIAVYPNWTKTPNGRKTIFHNANLTDEHDLYGRPRDSSVLMPMYIEYSILDWASKISKNEITSKVVLAFQEPEMAPVASDDANERRAKALRSVMTSAREAYVNSHGEVEQAPSQSKTIALISYQGDKAPTPIKLDITRDTAWFETQMLSMSNYIFVVNGIPKELAGFERSKGSLNSHSGEFILQQFNTTDISAVRPRQEAYASYEDKMLHVIGEFAGISDIHDVGVRWEKTISRMVDEAMIIDSKISKRDGTMPADTGVRDTGDEA